MAFYLRLKHGNTDLYPLLRKSMENPEVYNEEIVRNEMFKHLGYYVTESSGHASEYNQWFRKRPELIEKYCTHGTGWNPGLHAYSLNLRLERKDHWREEIDKWINEEEVNPTKSTEYASDIFNARFGDPETEVVLPLISSDICDIFEAVATGVETAEPTWETLATLGIVLASKGYPGSYEKGYVIDGLEAVDGMIYHMGTAAKDGKIVTAGGRVMIVVCQAPTLREAQQKAAAEVAKIKCDNLFYRRDIGWRVL